LRREKITGSRYPAVVIDVQGAELLVLKGAGEMLQNFRYIKAEAADFESHVNAAKLDDLNRFLRPLGFTEINRQKFAAHPNEGTYWDVLWERKGAGFYAAIGDLFRRAGGGNQAIESVAARRKTAK
jgi:hypothetical protein